LTRPDGPVFFLTDAQQIFYNVVYIQGKQNGNKMITSLFHLFSQYNFQQISQYIFVNRAFTKFFHFVYDHLGSKCLVGLLLFVFISGHYLPVQAQFKPKTKEAADKKPAIGDDKSAKKIDDQEKNADYWYDRGILVSAYGNDKAAIQYFQKVIELDPRRSDAYFQLGVSYGELGQYEKAVGAIGKAIELNPDKSVYYYGRGRIHLLSGDEDKALTDLKKAAEMGSRDAIRYFERFPDLD
jgi:tetratricopeptide (TPR) repeat protein